VTQFRVLPARRGDAYLLKSRRGSYLIDGGAQESLLPEMLTDRKVNKLRAVVCSSPSPERLGGIIELMEAGHPVAEYWLPDRLEILPELARRFSGDWEGWLGLVSSSNRGGDSTLYDWGGGINPLPDDNSLRRLQGAAVLIGLAMTACLGWAPYKGMSRDAFFGGDRADPSSGLAHFFGWTLELLSDRAATRWENDEGAAGRILRRMGWRLSLGGSLEETVLLCGRLLQAEAEMLSGPEGSSIKGTVQSLTMAAMLTAMVAKTESRVRFFRQTGRLEDHLVPKHPLKCLNGIEVSPLSGVVPLVSPERLFRETRGLTGRSEGLVFQYGDRGCGVLFCGDTKMNFLGSEQPVILDRPTVIAAPRQGNCSSDVAYARIESQEPERDMWVRSHFSYARKVSDNFKWQANKQCLNNCVHHAVQEILLEYSGQSWIVKSGGSCICG